MLPDSVLEILHQIAKNERFSKYTVDTESGSNHGDNYLGVLTAVTISGTKCDENETCKEEKLHLLCKLPPSDEVRKETFQTTLVFERELFVYSKLLPDFVEFQREKGLMGSDLFSSFPKVFACETNKETDTYILIMEDLRAKEFEMWPKEKVIQLEHELLFLRELGKFHAISFAMKDQRPNEFKKYEELEDTLISLCINGPWKPLTEESIEKAINVLENPDHKKLMQHFQQRYEKTVDELLFGESSKEFGVVVHGDCWITNLLFRYADSDKKGVDALSIVDWQIAHYCSPVLDVVYHIFTATDKPFRDKHYNELLNAYYSSLSENIRKLGSDPIKLYTFQHFQDQLRKFGEFILFGAPGILQQKLAKAEDIADMDEYAKRIENGEKAYLIKPFVGETQKEYSRLINGLLTDLVDYGYVKVE